MPPRDSLLYLTPVMSLVCLLLAASLWAEDLPGSRHLPAQFTPGAVRAALVAHLDHEVLPWLTRPDAEDPAPSWAADAGMPIIRVLRRLYVHSLAIERTDDQGTRERLRDQYDALFGRLVEGFRDPADGAWIVATTHDGHGVLRAEKQTVSQVYVIYIMAELAGRLSDSRARALALETFADLEARGHDRQFGGYVERVDLPLDAPENAVKQLGTNMHAALAMARLFRIAPSALLRQRLEELLDIFTTHTPLVASGNAPLAFTRDWQPTALGENPQQQTLYGHNAELVSYTVEAIRALGRDPRDYLPWLRRVTAGVIRNGIGSDGRVYTWGPWVGPRENPNQLTWWPHTEAAITLARMYQLTGEDRYWKLCERVLRFTFERFVPDHSGAWYSDINTADGFVADGSGQPWFAGLHTTRMLLECDRALREVELPPVPRREGRVTPARAVQMDTGFAYYQGRSAASIAAEVAANGYDTIHLICLTDSINPPDLADAAHAAGLKVWGGFFPSGVYMAEARFPPESREWHMEFTGRGIGGYRFLSYVHPGYQAWWKAHLTRFYSRYNLDGLVWYEVHYPTQQGMTAYGLSPVFGDVSPGFQAAFRRATGRRVFPDFTDPQSPSYYQTDRNLYGDYVEFRVNSVIAFQREVLDGPGGFRRAFPGVPFAGWTIVIRHDGGLEALRENEAQDPARLVAELWPDMHFLQTHAPDWSARQLGPDYVRHYAPYAAAARAADPQIPLGVQADVGSTLPWRRDPEWMAGFERACRHLGAETTTYYEFSLRWEVYFAAPKAVSGTVAADGRATIVFDQRIAPASCAFLEGHELPGGGRVSEVAVDGNLLHFRITGPASNEPVIPIGGITDEPTVRYPLMGRPESEAQGPTNAVPAGMTVTLQRR
ncbi:MAG: hypothetical protein HPY69_11625 [Armatimonadetes bacterium]|nr:hypothetical protein [Armatimonadota bacterium]